MRHRRHKRLISFYCCHVLPCCWHVVLINFLVVSTVTVMNAFSSGFITLHVNCVLCTECPLLYVKVSLNKGAISGINSNTCCEFVLTNTGLTETNYKTCESSSDVHILTFILLSPTWDPFLHWPLTSLQGCCAGTRQTRRPRLPEPVCLRCYNQLFLTNPALLAGLKTNLFPVFSHTD